MTEPFVILFDGVCNLCNGSVQFVIRHDPGQKFKFASLQGKTGRQFLQQHALPVTQFHSFVLIEKDRIYTRSTAALRVLKKTKGWWKLLYIFIVVPRFLRDGIYNWVARNRYKWFGKKEQCMLPAPDIQSRFLD